MSSIRLVTRDDEPLLIPLLRELDDRYGGKAPDERIAEAAALLAKPPAFGPTTIVAAAGPRLVGVCILCNLFPAHAMGTTWWLEDIFVTAAARGSGLGRRLMDATVALARERGILRIEWATDPANHVARALYAEIGASAPADVLYRLELD